MAKEQTALQRLISFIENNKLIKMMKLLINYNIYSL